MATVSETTLRKILRNARIKPFQVSYYCERRDPEFDEKPGIQAIATTGEDRPPIPNTDKRSDYQRDYEVLTS